MIDGAITMLYTQWIKKSHYTNYTTLHSQLLDGHQITFADTLRHFRNLLTHNQYNQYMTECGVASYTAFSHFSVYDQYHILYENYTLTAPLTKKLCCVYLWWMYWRMWWS